MIEITHGDWTASIAPLGAELRSLTYQGEEMIWEGDPEIWSGTAPVLFPIVGFVQNNQYSFEGQSYTIEKHGLARRASFQVVEHNDASATFAFTDTAQTRQAYPFAFTLTVQFTLHATGLSVRYQVDNPSDRHMYFSLGSHPAFAIDAKNIPAYAIRFEQPEDLLRWAIIDEGIIPLAQEDLRNQDTIQLRPDIFDLDALIYRGIQSQWVDLIGPKKHLRITTGGAPDLGIWAKPGAGFVCIEPWFGHNDLATATGQLTEKAGIIALPGQQSWQTEMTISVPGITAQTNK